MLWDNPNDSKDWQRLKNMVFLNMPVSNATRDEALPGLLVGLGVFLLVAGGFALFG